MKPSRLSRFRLHLLLIALLFALYAFDVSGLTLAQTARQAPLALLLVAVVDSTVLAWLVRGLRSDTWRSALGIFVLFFGVKAALVAVEAAYLPDVLPPETARVLLLNGALTGALFAPALVTVWRNPTAYDVPDRARRPWYGWLWRLASAGLLWVVIFVAVGLLVFQPLATALDPVTAEAYLSAFTPDAPGAILLFQAGRGALWALLTIPVLGLMQGSRRDAGLAVALAYAGLMGSNLLLPNDVLPDSIRLAHLAEVVVENALFGFVVARLLWLPALPEGRTERLQQVKKQKGFGSHSLPKNPQSWQPVPPMRRFSPHGQEQPPGSSNNGYRKRLIEE